MKKKRVRRQKNKTLDLSLTFTLSFITSLILLFTVTQAFRNFLTNERVSLFTTLFFTFLAVALLAILVSIIKSQITHNIKYLKLHKKKHFAVRKR